LDNIAYLIVPLLQGFEWFDEGLQASLQARGWPTLTGPESMVVIHVIVNIVKPSEIARSMGLTRQAVHITIGQMVKKGILELLDDPVDKRGKIVSLTTTGKAMRRDAQMTVQYCAEQLAARIGDKHVQNLKAAFATNWGEPVICPLQPGERSAVRTRLRQRGLAGAEHKAGTRPGAGPAKRAVKASTTAKSRRGA
jgi:DNA-binding MarR family transcriptional regulator